MKLYLLPFILLTIMAACSPSNESLEDSDLTESKKSISVNNAEQPQEERLKTQTRTRDESLKTNIKPDTDDDKVINQKYLSKNLNSGAVLGKSYKDYDKEELEKLLMQAFENIDPLEYYLQNNPRYTDKKDMFNKKTQLNELYEVYTKKFYDRGHLQEMRDNNAVLVSLVSDAYPTELIEKYDSIAHKDNSSLIKFKKSDTKNFDYSTANPLSELNRAVVLLSNEDYKGADAILERLLNGPLPNNYLVNYNKGFVAYKTGDFKASVKYANRSILARENFYLGYLLLGESFLSLGDFKQALKAFQKSLEIKNNVVSMERVAYA